MNASIADSTIIPGSSRVHVVARSYSTQDIVSVILAADAKGNIQRYTAAFAPSLLSSTLQGTCHNIWQFIKKNIAYQADPADNQLVKSPGQLWTDKVGDCKSFALFTASILRNLGIGYKYRFTAYGGASEVHHVYVVATSGRVEIPIDAVWSRPNSEKTFDFKKDYPMAQLAYVTGMGATRGGSRPRPNFRGPGKRKPVTIDLGSNEDWASGNITDEEFTLMLTRARLMEYHKAKAKGVNAAILEVDARLREIRNAKKAAQVGKTLFGKALSFLGKVVTAPARLLLKGILEISLPKSSEYFIYLFIPETKLSLCPPKVKTKREKQMRIRNFIVDKIGFKETHFTQIVRAGILKQYGKEPEVVLSDHISVLAYKLTNATLDMRPTKDQNLIDRQQAIVRELIAQNAITAPAGSIYDGGSALNNAEGGSRPVFDKSEISIRGIGILDPLTQALIASAASALLGLVIKYASGGSVDTITADDVAVIDDFDNPLDGLTATLVNTAINAGAEAAGNAIDKGKNAVIAQANQLAEGIIGGSQLSQGMIDMATNVLNGGSSAEVPGPITPEPKPQMGTNGKPKPKPAKPVSENVKKVATVAAGGAGLFMLAKMFM